MIKLTNRDEWRRIVVGVAAGTVAAVGLWAVGLVEIAWLPYAAVAMSSARPTSHRFARPFGRRARS